ncbi:hypothetical protein [Microcoleus sp. B7-D4]
MLITEQPTADISAFAASIGLSLFHHKKPDRLAVSHTPALADRT